jgi:hypothetical protein
MGTKSGSHPPGRSANPSVSGHFAMRLAGFEPATRGLEVRGFSLGGALFYKSCVVASLVHGLDITAI